MQLVAWLLIMSLVEVRRAFSGLAFGLSRTDSSGMSAQRNESEVAVRVLQQMDRPVLKTYRDTADLATL